MSSLENRVKTRVNLYSETLLPKKLVLSFHKLSLLLALLLGVAIVAVSTLYWQSQQVMQQLNVAIQTSADFEQERQQLEQQLAVHKPANKWVMKVDQQRKLLNIKNRLLDELSQRKEVQSESYAQLLTELAETADGGSWLTHIQIDENNLQLAGDAIEAVAVPRWLERLQTTDTLSGRKFDGVKFTRKKEGVISFELIAKPLANNEMNNQQGAQSK